MITLGIKPFSHDAAVALVKDGLVVAASAEERFSRVKHSGGFPYKAIDFALAKAGLSGIDQVDEIAIIFNYPRLISFIHVWGFFRFFPRHTRSSIVNGSRQILKIYRIYRTLRRELGYSGRIRMMDHHDCHASSVLLTSRWVDPAVLTIDGRGERAATRIYGVSDGRLQKLVQLDYPNSLGVFYSSITEYLGFKRDEDEGKVMGLAPYGSDSLVEQMRDVLQLKGRVYKLNLKYFSMQFDPSKNVSSQFVEKFGEPRLPEEPIGQRHMDIARAAQVVLEEIVCALFAYAKDLTGARYLCVSGGVALNSVANGRALRLGLYEGVHLYPAAGDDGACVGAALQVCSSTDDGERFAEENASPYMGYESSDAEILEALNASGVAFTKSSDIATDVAALLAENRVVGWFQGRAEFGPRALGNRSILANPSFPENKALVNSKIKFREPFRPFGPSVLAEEANLYFGTDGVASPYMLLTFSVRLKMAPLIPAVVHVDASARIQTVERVDNELYWRLIAAFRDQTGIPMLLNTSFNRMGEPMVNTPGEALSCYLGSGLDALAMGSFLVKRAS